MVHTLLRDTSEPRHGGRLTKWKRSAKGEGLAVAPGPRMNHGGPNTEVTESNDSLDALVQQRHAKIDQQAGA